MIRVSRILTILIGFLGATATAHAAWPPGGVEIFGEVHGASAMSLAEDGSGGVLQWWTGRDGQTNVVCRAARVAATGDVYPNWDVLYQYADRAVASPDGLGGLFKAYFDYDLQAWRAIHIAPGGGLDPTWPAGGRTITSGYASFPPLIVNDGAGGALVAFHWPISIGSRDSLRVRHLLANGGFDPAWPASGLRINSNDVYGFPFQGRSDGAGGALIVWADAHMRVQHVTSAGTIAAGWPVGGLALRDGNYAGTSLASAIVAMVPSGADHFFVAWVEDSASQRRIWLQRFHEDGTIASGWPAHAMFVYSGPTTQTSNVRMVADGATGAFVAWKPWNGPRGVRVLEDGSIAPGWSAGGSSLLVPSQSGSTSTGFDLTTGAGTSLIVTWRDGLNSSVPRLRTRWVLADGSSDPNQPDTGRVVSLAGDQPEVEATLPDGQGGVFVGWENGSPTYESGTVMLSWVPYSPELVTVPRSQTSTLAMRAWPNPARDGLEVSFALATESRALLELLDVTGRRVRALEVRGAGPHVVKLSKLGDVAPGVYLLRIHQGNAIRTTRVALFH